MNGVIADTILANATMAVLHPKPGASEFERNVAYKDSRLIVRVAATGAFRLNYVSSSDDGTTNYVIKQVAVTTVTVDGNTASFTKIAELDVPVAADGQVQIYNASGGDIHYFADVREYYAGS